jgi:hypothetical protein
MAEDCTQPTHVENACHLDKSYNDGKESVGVDVEVTDRASSATTLRRHVMLNTLDQDDNSAADVALWQSSAIAQTTRCGERPH